MKNDLSTTRPSQAKLESYKLRNKRRLAGPAPEVPQALDRLTARLKQHGKSGALNASALLSRIRPETTIPRKVSLPSARLPGLSIPATPLRRKAPRRTKFTASVDKGGGGIKLKTKTTEPDLPLDLDRAEMLTLSEIDIENPTLIWNRLIVLIKTCSRFRYDGNARHWQDVREKELPTVHRQAIALARLIELHLLDRDALLLYYWEILLEALIHCENRDRFQAVSEECALWLVSPWTSSLEGESEEGL
jgi:hypothetical protein